MPNPLVLTCIISIHAPREGGDCSTACALAVLPISIHAPREGGRQGLILLLD